METITQKIDALTKDSIDNGLVPIQVWMDVEDYEELKKTFGTTDDVKKIHSRGRPLEVLRHTGPLTIA